MTTIDRMKYSKTKVSKNFGTPVGVVGRGVDVCMLTRVNKKTSSSLALLYSKNGVDFVEDPQKVTVKYHNGKEEKIKSCQNFSLSRTPNGFVMTYVKSVGIKNKKHTLHLARSKDLYEWIVLSQLPVDDAHHTTVAYSKPRDRFELFKDGLFIKHESSSTLSFWKERPSLLFTSRNGQFDSEKIFIIGSIVTTEGILIIYDASVKNKNKTLLQAGAVILDVNNPKHIIWRSGMPVWQGIVQTKGKSGTIDPIGCVHLGKNLLIYWISDSGDLIVVKIPVLFKEVEESRHYPKIFQRHEQNPIIEPLPHSEWENEGTFNPAAVEDDEGTVHILYRAIGRDGISRIGYAKSKDGKDFSKRLSYPVFEPARGYGMPEEGKVMGPTAYNPYIYTSGGGWGGAEDPRAVIIEDTLYMLYTAFEGWSSMRIALTSISLEDFKAGRWIWKKPKLISSAENRSKNWLLFPEKVNGKFAVLHSISPKVLIEYVKDLKNFKGVIFSPRPEGPQPGRAKKWDTYLKGSGLPPVKTELGWLLLYHALEKTDTGKYRLGAMILDLKDPTKVLYRSSHPILSPDMHYENDGKPGVVYASGAVIRGDDLYVYYGGGDKVVCVATTPIKEFLKYMQTGNAKSYQLKKA